MVPRVGSRPRRHRMRDRGGLLLLSDVLPAHLHIDGAHLHAEAAAMAPRGEMWLLLAGVFGLISALTYPMARFGGASFIRGRLYQPGSLDGAVAQGWKGRLFVPALLVAYAALQLAEIFLVPGGNAPYSDPQAYYIPAALDILSGKRCTTIPVSSTCNYEHPPLDKLFLALSIKDLRQERRRLLHLPAPLRGRHASPDVWHRQGCERPEGGPIRGVLPLD